MLADDIHEYSNLGKYVKVYEKFSYTLLLKIQVCMS